jgi:hypothetical protein
MVLCGLGVLVLLRCCVAGGLVPAHDRLLQFVVLMEACAPPAQLIIVSLHRLDLRRVAAGMAYLYIFAYSASIFTMTVWTAAAISLIY